MIKSQLSRERNKLLLTIDKVLDGPMAFLGFVWLILLIVELISGLPRILEIVSICIWALFIIDFLIKFMLAPFKLKYLAKNSLTVVSLIIPAIRVFRLLRILRLIRGVRVLKIVGSLNRSMRSLAATMSRRGFAYVVLLTIIVIFAGAAGMFAIEKHNPGFSNYGLALWWTSMRVITAGSDFWPVTAEGRVLAFILSLFGYAVFGYVTATLATFFIGRDAENERSPVVGAKDVHDLKKMIQTLTQKMEQIQRRIP
jgi:voltage-gated potassium channel